MRNREHGVHTDDLYDVDDRLEVGRVGRHHVVLSPVQDATEPTPCDGHHIIPKPVIAADLAAHPDRATRSPR